jgi:hypothetical protein
MRIGVPAAALLAAAPAQADTIWTFFSRFP